MQQPSYYAIIPAEVRYSELKPSAKLLYGEITALANKKGYCFSTNNYFAELYNVTKNTISLWIKDLLKHGFISVEIKYEIEKTWNLEKRLKRWVNNSNKWGNKKESKVETIMSAHQNVKEMIKKANQL